VNNTLSCPLCYQAELKVVPTRDQRIYYHCQICSLVFLDQQMLPDAEQEKTRYTHHQNSINDEGYTTFLRQAIQAASPYFSAGMRVLDYGCGPEPVLAQLLERDEGLQCNLYDPFFFPDRPAGQYDLIFATETFEHFFSPAQELNRLYQLLAPLGYLCTMTNFWQSLDEFDQWWYRRDPTHVCFYHQDTFRYIEKQWQLKDRFNDHKRVFILQKM